MPRQPRIDLPGIPQHIVQRGNDRQPCFFTDLDDVRYLQELRDLARREHCPHSTPAPRSASAPGESW